MDRNKGRNSWLVFLLPVLVSAAVMFACGAVFLTGEPGAEAFDFGSGVARKPTRAELEESDRPADLEPAELDAPARPRPIGPLGSLALRRELHPAEPARPSSEDEEVDWELEMADSEEIEPTPEMIEEERQKIREGRSTFGFPGRPGARLAESIQKRLFERRAERQEQNSGPATIASPEDTEIRSDETVIEPGTAGAGPR